MPNKASSYFLCINLLAMMAGEQDEKTNIELSSHQDFHYNKILI